MVSITPAVRDLLALIRAKEAPRGYDQIYSYAEAKLGRQPLTQMTAADVYRLQQRMLDVGSPSTALGGYQFIRKTLAGLYTELEIPADARFNEDLQDGLAMHLLERRGLYDFLAGKINRHTFANRLAMEWASLPVVTNIQGAHRSLKPGHSYYTGDNLNKSFHDPEDILAAVDALKASPGPGTPETPTSPPQPPSLPRTEDGPQHTGIFWLIGRLIKLIFGKD